MSNPGFASLTAGMLVRKGDAKPSQEPLFGSIPWSARSSAAATASAGIRWPPVPPPAMSTTRRGAEVSFIVRERG